jgi:hypothetical protein
MLLAKKKAQGKPVPDPRADSIQGTYVAKEARIEQKKAFSGASFLLGGHYKSKLPKD